MKKFLFNNIVAVAIFSFIGLQSAYGSHLIGGEITYECQGIENINGVDFITFEFTATMYRDCQGGGANFDFPATFYLFEGSDVSWSYTDQETAFPEVEANVEVTSDPCIEPPSNVCLDIGTYKFEMTFPVSTESYQIVYQRCCRNNTIQNTFLPEETGVTFSVTISALAQDICNNSPVFNGFPPAVICVDRPLFFDHSASDVDGHTIVYEFCAPLNGGGLAGINGGNATDCDGITPDVEFCPPPYDDLIFKLPDFGAQFPLGTNAQLAIDPNTGQLTGLPGILGQFVVGICISEYLNGELLSQVRRDFQFNVTNCVIVVEANLEEGVETGPKNLKLTHCGSDPLDIINTSQDEAFINGYEWQFYISGDSVLTYDTRDVSIPFGEPGFYTGVMILNPEEEGCSDTIFLEIDVFPEMTADFEFEYDTCVAGPVKFEDASLSETGVILAWDWEFEPTENSNFQDPKHEYLLPGPKKVFLQSTDLNGCVDTITKFFDYYPVPPVIIVEPNAFAGCAPFEIKFNNLSAPIDSTYQIFWDFGDGTFGNNLNETHVYEEIGVYSIGVEIVSPLDCQIQRDYPFWIEVLPEPIADFTFTPENPKGENVVIQFFNNSTDAVSWQYIFNNTATVYQPNTTYIFDTLGQHFIDLIVAHPSGCPDTIRKTLNITPTSSYFIPNAFSPNNDGVNETFVGKGNTAKIKAFKMEIYARSGEHVFSTESIEEAWNGKKFNTGSELPMDVYVYKYRYIDALGEKVEADGFVTLVR